MWKLWNKLFGWNYIIFRNGAYSYILRVRVTLTERRSYVYFTSNQIIFLLDEGKTEVESYTWISLT